MDIFLIIIVVMLALGITDLIVGVGNDAVNFTNSAVGSKVASQRTIMIVASIGIIIGVMTSTGMMEIARKGIFHPEGFTLLELMQLFLAVMITDVVLLDLYNTLGLPTSTTVSLVFELLGAAIVLAIWKSDSVADAFTLINSAQALKIIAGIVLSIIVAFISGIIIQFIARSIFSFDIERTIRYFGGLFGGLAFTTIVFFVLLVALKSSSAIPETMVNFLEQHFRMVLLWVFVSTVIISQTLVLLRVNILKYVVLLGTGGLALAFAGNDLVNFIGVPLAGLNVYELIVENSYNADILGTALSGQINPPSYIFYAAAAIMVVTLWFSKKAQTVSKTEVGLATQGDTHEAFSANPVARTLVQVGLSTWTGIRSIIPIFLRRFFAIRYEMSPNQKNRLLLQDGHAFDLLRASVNIVTASCLILYGTLNKLPLSTTFVIFMVAMGSSLSDRAWGRDNAVFRVSGVLTVIGGWFMTAMMASITAGLVVTFIHLVGFWSMLVLLPATVSVIFLLGKVHKKRKKDYDHKVEQLAFIRQSPDKALEKSLTSIADSMVRCNEVLRDTAQDLVTGKRRHTKSTDKALNKLVSFHKLSINQIVEIANNHFSDRDLMSMHSFTSALNNVKYIIESVRRIHELTIERVTLYQTPLTNGEAKDIRAMRRFSAAIVNKIVSSIEERSIKTNFALKRANELIKIRMEIHNNQLSRMKHGTSKVKTSVSYLMIIDEMASINDNLITLYNNLTKIIPWVVKKRKKEKKNKNKAEI